MPHLSENAKLAWRRFAIAGMITAATATSIAIDPPGAAAQALPSPKPAYGSMWYEKYCTPCHGVGGAPGSAVFAQTKQPVDLRTYVARNGGTFPTGEWLAVVFAEPPQNPHTEVWERIRRDETGGTIHEVGARGKVRSIADYVLSIQAK